MTDEEQQGQQEEYAGQQSPQGASRQRPDRQSDQQGRPGADQEAGQGARGNQQDATLDPDADKLPPELRQAEQQAG
jgi:hypothetical protein